MWRAERIAWGVMAALLVAAVAGVFGNGLWSRAETKSAATAMMPMTSQRVTPFGKPSRRRTNTGAATRARAGRARKTVVRNAAPNRAAGPNAGEKENEK